MDKNARPIILPGHPFWDVLRRFGQDQTLAMIVNFSATLALTLFLGSKWGQSFGEYLLVLGIGVNLIFAIVGPIVEKVGFFPIHIKNAWDEYNAILARKRKKFRIYLKKHLREGLKSMIEDIIIHDSVYITLMYVGLNRLPQTPPWMISIFSFVVAVFIVAGVEVGIVEFLYWNYKRSLKKLGFRLESYFESRFNYDSQEKAEEVFRALIEEYELGTLKNGVVQKGETRVIEYRDRYLDNKLMGHNNRKWRLRFRMRGHEDGHNALKSVQIISTLVSEMAKKELKQWRFFSIRKEKMYYPLSNGMVWSAEDVDPGDSGVRKALQKAQDGSEFSEINFQRKVAQNPKTLLVSLDRMKSGAVVLEIKAYPEQKGLLKEAMRFVMSRGGLQTTHDKLRISAV